ncbi:MAG: DsbA family protein, partial [Methyloceanibacter sp.]
IGLDGDEALAILTDGRYAEDVRQDEQFWISRGIEGVPAMIFDEKYLVVGAQGVDNYRSILEKIAGAHAA